MFGTIFCALTAFLLEFAKIVQVVRAIADVVDAGGSFVGRRHPKHVEACFRQGRRFGNDFSIEGSIGWIVPFEVLDHCVFHSFIIERMEF